MISKRTFVLSALIGATGLVATGVAAYADGGRDRHRGPGMEGGGMRMYEMMARLDGNDDGKLTQAEIDKVREDRLAKFDTDKDGKLNLQEFEALWLDFTRDRMVRTFQRLDRDGDAAVTQGEYLAPTKHLVERMDRNDDGELSRDDMRRRHMRDGDDRGHRRHMGDDDMPRRGQRD